VTALGCIAVGQDYCVAVQQLSSWINVEKVDFSALPAHRRQSVVSASPLNYQILKKNTSNARRLICRWVGRREMVYLKGRVRPALK